MLMDMNIAKQAPLQFNPQQMINSIVPLVDLAGEAIMRIYQHADYSVQIKDDQSPVTQADLQANVILVDGLKKLWPSIPVLSEEGGDLFINDRSSMCYWAVDPLDGTKEFIERNGEFTVNVALIHRGDPVLGVVLAPALNRLYVGYRNDRGTFKCRKSLEILSIIPEKIAMKREVDKWINIHVGQFAEKDFQRSIRVASSRSHPSRDLAIWLKRFEKYEVIEVGSSLKFCMVAEGLIDIYPRFGPTCVWDTAAGHAILIAAGGAVFNYKMNVPMYYQDNRTHNSPFIAMGEQKILSKLLTLI